MLRKVERMVRQRLMCVNGGLKAKVMFHVRPLAPILNVFCRKNKTFDRVGEVQGDKGKGRGGKELKRVRQSWWDSDQGSTSSNSPGNCYPIKVPGG